MIKGMPYVPSDEHRTYHVDIQPILDRHSVVFGDMPAGPDRIFQHIIELEPGSKPIVITPYRHPRI